MSKVNFLNIQNGRFSKNLQKENTLIQIKRIVFVFVQYCCVTCSWCSLSARVDVSRWMVTS